MTEKKKITITYGDETYTVARRPNALLISEVAYIDTGDTGAIGALSEFFRETLGEDYGRFRRNFFSAELDSTEDEVEALAGLLQEIVRKTTDRPTQ